MKGKEQRKAEAIARQAEYDALTSKQKLMKLDLQVGDKGAVKQRAKLQVKWEIEHTASIPEGVGDSTNKKEKKPYQKPKRS